MKLYEVPNKSKVRLKSPEKGPPASIDPIVGEVYTFNHTDGMYSNCTDSKGNLIHLTAWAEVEIVK